MGDNTHYRARVHDFDKTREEKAAMLRRLLLCLMMCFLCIHIVHPRMSYPLFWLDLPSNQLLEQANAFTKSNHVDSAMVCYSIVASRLGKVNGAERRNSLVAICKMGKLYQYHYYNYQKSADYLLRAKHEALIDNDSVLLSSIYNDLGCLYVQYENGDFSRSMENFKQAYHYMSPQSIEAEVCMFNFVYNSIKFGYYDKIVSEINEYCTRQPSPNFITHLCQAGGAISSGNYNQAIVHIDHALSTVDERVSELQARYEGCLRLLRSILLDKAGRDSEALNELVRYEQLVRAHGFKEGIPDIYDRYYHFYATRGNTVLAEKNQLKYFLLVDSMNAITQLAYLNKASFVFDLQKATEEIRIQEVQRERLTQILWIVTIAAIIFMALVFALYRRNKQLRERNQALYDQSLQQLAIIDEARKNSPPVQAPIPIQETTPEAESPTTTEQAVAETSSNIPDPVLEDVFRRVKAIMESSPEIYDEDFSLSKLHVMVGGNIKNISRAIAACAHCDLKALLSQYRIREACRRINDVEHYGNYTIEAIAKSVGVTSRTSFVQNFKRQTGLTPSAYLKMARQQQTKI